MIQYSNINDAWGNKEIFKKNLLNNSNDFTKPVAPIVTPNAVEIEPKTLAPAVLTTNQPTPKFTPPYENNVLTATPNKESFHAKSCSFAEHLKECQECRNSMYEHFKNTNSAVVNLLGYELYISKDFLKILFIIIIIAIFILLLSFINVPIPDNLNVNPTNIKYIIPPMHHMNHINPSYYL